MLFESERKVMEVLWREGSLTAGEISKILALETGWNRNTTYTVINKCIGKGYIVRGKNKFICTAVLSKSKVQREELSDIIEKYFDGSPVRLFNTLAEISEKQDLKKMKKIIKNTD
ncbi:MAG: BlaI/MecI/CopY family transcriptional regulator [Oscillospiraceae bacterium]|nr:BlaI/MecI/CopY family transcriptional regulator [Oscillospiraceae bacterium]